MLIAGTDKKRCLFIFLYKRPMKLLTDHDTSHTVTHLTLETIELFLVGDFESFCTNILSTITLTASTMGTGTPGSGVDFNDVMTFVITVLYTKLAVEGVFRGLFCLATSQTHEIVISLLRCVQASTQTGDRLGREQLGGMKMMRLEIEGIESTQCVGHGYGVVKLKCRVGPVLPHRRRPALTAPTGEDLGFLLQIDHKVRVVEANDISDDPSDTLFDTHQLDLVFQSL